MWRREVYTSSMSRAGYSKLSNRFFYTPALAYLLAFGVFPLILSVYFSSPNTRFSSYVALFEFPQLPIVIRNTLIFSFGTAGFATLLGLVLAVFADSLKRGGRLTSILVYLPFTVPFTASALIWTTIYDPIFGPANYLASLVGLPKLNWLGQPSLQIYSTTIVSVWSSVPLAFLLILAGLRSVPKSVKEAAKMDGMGLGEYYINIGLPLSRGSILTGFLLTLILAFGNFDLPYILNSGYSYSMATLPFLVWFEIFYQNLVSQGLAAGVLLTAIVSVFSYALVRLTFNPKPSKIRGKVALRGVRRAFSKVFMPTTYALSILTILFLVFPIYWMLLIAFRPGSLNFVYPPIMYPKVFNPATFLTTLRGSEPYVITTLVVSLCVVVLTVLMAAPAAFSVARQNKRWLLLMCIYLYGLPSTSYVFGVYTIIYHTHLLNTWLGLILTYPLFTLPFAVWTLTNFYSTLPKHYEEASLIDGYTPIKSFYRVVMPLARPGLFATALLSFIFSWHLLLFPLVLSETPYQYNFPPTGSFTVTNFATLFDPQSLGSTVTANVWGQVGSAGIILAVPVMIIAVLAQDYLLKGLYSGGTRE
ncbi:MAG: ABC transporter permease subunit [Thermoprotei archaeon]